MVSNYAFLQANFFMKMAEAREELQIAQQDFSKLEATHLKVLPASVSLVQLLQ